MLRGNYIKFNYFWTVFYYFVKLYVNTFGWSPCVYSVLDRRLKYPSASLHSGKPTLCTLVTPTHPKIQSVHAVYELLTNDFNDDVWDCGSILLRSHVRVKWLYPLKQKKNNLNSPPATLNSFSAHTKYQ